MIGLKFYSVIFQLLSFIIIITLLVIKTNVNGAISTGKKCQRADKCALTLIPLTDEKFIEKPPRTSMDMREWCQRIVQMERCLKDYAQKCLNKQSRQTLSVLLFSISRTNKRYCTNKKRQKSFLNYVDCFHSQIHLIANDLLNMTKDFHAIPLVKEKTLRLPLTCW